MIDLIGYIATAFILISFCVKDMVSLRIINSVGSVLWIWYGISIKSNPTIFVNLAVLVIHLVWLMRRLNPEILTLKDTIKRLWKIRIKE